MEMWMSVAILLSVAVAVAASVSALPVRSLVDGSCSQSKPCATGFCCNKYNFCGQTTAYCSETNCQFQCPTGTDPPTLPVTPVTPVPPVTPKPATTNVFTSHHDFKAAAKNYAIDGLYCAKYISSKPLAWRKMYKWAALCDGSMKPSTCGRCIKVTNPLNKQSVTVRLLDSCSNGGLNMDVNAFKAIDGIGNGIMDGHLHTSYEFVRCP